MLNQYLSDCSNSYPIDTVLNTFNMNFIKFGNDYLRHNKNIHINNNLLSNSINFYFSFRMYSKNMK